jgi:putative aldouronate transport system permease protein
MGIPGELIDSARIDGANDLQILTRIVLPLSKAVIAVIALFYAVGYWNNFFTALLYLNNSSMWPLALVLRGRGGESAPVPSAAIVVAILPILAVYPFLQRYFTRGVLSGAIKG